MLESKCESLLQTLRGIADGLDAYATSTAKLQVDIKAAVTQIEEMFTQFRKTQKDGMGEILEQLK